jgi:hypothetical protein
MTQMAIDLDEETLHQLQEASHRAGISAAAWAEKAVQNQLQDRLSDSFFQVLGTWQDDRTPEEILRDIRADVSQKARAPLQ